MPTLETCGSVVRFEPSVRESPYRSIDAPRPWRAAQSDLVSARTLRKSAQLDQAKLLRIAPENLEDTFALRIVRVLKQLDTLLGMSLLSSMEEVIRDSMINKVEGRDEASLYAGFPTPLTIREMQKTREALTVYAYLLLAEVGLFSILAHYTPNEKFEQFRAVTREYVRQFLVAIGPVGDLTLYKDNQDLFKWVAEDDDRAKSQSLVRNIVGSLEVIEILRSSKGVETS